MRTKLAFALLASLLVMSGCGGAKNDDPTFDGPVVPWTASQPTELAARAPTSTPCRGADFKATDDVKFTGYGNGGAIAVIALKNQGTQACRLDGTPQVRLVKDGGPQQVNTALGRPPLIFPDTAYPLSSLLAVKPGEVVGLTITWDNWCDRQIPGKKRLPPSAVRITLPGGNGHVDAGYNAVPACHDPKMPSDIGVSPFETAKVQATAPWTSAAITASVPGQPLAGKRGEVLKYTVVLKNTSAATIDFDRCPAYVQQLVPAGQVEVYNLDCAKAKPIAPGKSEGFSMEIRVPKSAPLGGNGLFWALDAFSAKQPQLTARAVIAR